ncbi:MAG: hypothetical protein ACRD2O_00160 [Terriglobia bacterium]
MKLRRENRNTQKPGEFTAPAMPVSNPAPLTALRESLRGRLWSLADGLKMNESARIQMEKEIAELQKQIFEVDRAVLLAPVLKHLAELCK